MSSTPTIADEGPAMVAALPNPSAVRWLATLVWAKNVLATVVTVAVANAFEPVLYTNKSDVLTVSAASPLKRALRG